MNADVPDVFLLRNSPHEHKRTMTRAIPNGEKNAKERRSYLAQIHRVLH